MKALRTLLFSIALAAALGGTSDLYAASREPRQKLTREERRAERERRVTIKADETTGREIREGKRPSYNRLLKSTNYKLMFSEGMRYYNMKKKNSENNSLGNLRKAQSLLDQAIVSQRFSGSPQEDSLYYFRACAYFQAQDFEASQEFFDEFRHKYGGSIFIEEAEYKFTAGFY